MQSPPSSLPRCRCKHSVSAPLFTVLGWLMQQKSSAASVLAGKHSNTVPPCGKAQEDKWSYSNLLTNSCSHRYQETITSFISATSILHKPSTNMFSFQWLFLAASFCFCIMKHCLKCHLSLKNNVKTMWFLHDADSIPFMVCIDYYADFGRLQASPPALTQIFSCSFTLLAHVLWCRILQTHHFPGSSVMSSGRRASLILKPWDYFLHTDSQETGNKQQHFKQL